MSKQLAFDLRLARKKSGLMQRDVAHLLDIGQATLSDLERGLYRPSIDQICTLSLIYGRSFEHFFAEVLDHGRDNLRSRISSLTTKGGDEATAFRREGTLRRLEEQITVQQSEDEIS